MFIKVFSNKKRRIGLFVSTNSSSGWGYGKRHKEEKKDCRFINGFHMLYDVMTTWQTVTRTVLVSEPLYTPHGWLLDALSPSIFGINLENAVFFNSTFWVVFLVCFKKLGFHNFNIFLLWTWLDVSSSSLLLGRSRYSAAQVWANCSVHNLLFGEVRKWLPISAFYRCWWQGLQKQCRQWAQLLCKQ